MDTYAKLDDGILRIYVRSHVSKNQIKAVQLLMNDGEVNVDIPQEETDWVAERNANERYGEV